VIITKLQGGLGNQLFQYAAGRSLAQKHETSLKFDVSWYNNYANSVTPRRLGLDLFSVAADIAADSEVEKFRKLGVPRLIEKIKPYKWKKHVQEKHFHFDSRVLSLPNNVYLEGHWQSEKYFQKNRDIIDREVTLKKPIEAAYGQLIHAMKQTDSVSVHIRRGDYVSHAKAKQVHGICSPVYYAKAIEIIKTKINTPAFFVFSDDIPWVKANIKIPFDIVTFVSERKDIKDYEELVLMSKCKHNIIANSSFSWWGAWLNRNPDKIVIAPERWFADSSFNTKDLLPESWMKI